MQDNIEVRCQDALEKAKKFTKGVYQESILRGYQAWSGADIKGKAGRYKSRYARSRDNLFNRMKNAGIPVDIEVRKNGKLVLVIGE